MMPMRRLSAHPPLGERPLEGRVIVVTGATGGLGSAVAHAVSAAGATPVLIGKRKRELEKLYDALVEAGGAQPAIAPMNLETATPNDFDEIVAALQRELGRLDGLVHCAVMFEGLTPMAMHKPDEWLKVLQVNVSAPFALTQSCMPLMQAAEDSAVIFVTDDPQRMGRAHWGAYGVSKAAVERMASILHDETDDSTLRVHVLLPGPMRTSLRRMAWFGEDTMKHPTPEATAQAVVHLLSAQGAAARGAIIDLRPQDAERASDVA
ncbi:SDR family NAD(P)-dependent oxidoreductase [Oleiagrimonas soli]|uniref:NAD(P)-dependent dehydrogenase (Short-subunit alcohol dehydrogenase family) n=1 Tax=Oleiagrimonas soli TaxID=1543381 RepID=A0A099CYH5_9GAMM|nr:SDR family NAD(P)-dependent oxidoreductase [Oleiagrimonas soli]KGI78662.1 short-chain dehydrogenase [Oleiagrimonas soli]MBB6184029.1 NAD(P)-dependent dehydrogenase (short-subunit alcohol dehydrogenase family) [Oleiagrimonas soli]